MATDALDVFLHDQHIAAVRPTSNGTPHEVSFIWDQDYEAEPVRLSESFTAIAGVPPNVGRVSRYLGGYGPEGNQRRAMTSERGIDDNDLFGILREFGGSIGGALTFRFPHEDPLYSPSYEELSDSELGRLLKKSVDDNDLGQREDSRSMIPGFQPKILLARFGDTWLQPHGRAHSTHILKPQLKSRPHGIADEFYSHELSRGMGLSTFGSEIAFVGATRYLAIERFDRTVRGETVELVHQEDAAQALGLDWLDDSAKFQNVKRPRDRHRPSAFAIAEIVAALNGESPLIQWLRQLTYRVLIGDNDGHAKNVGILHLPGEDTLTELYDAVPNLYQDGRIDWTMALAIDGQFDHRRISVERLIAEAASWQVLGNAAIEATIAKTLLDFETALSAVPLPKGISGGLSAGLAWNLSRLQAGQEISEPRRRPLD
ncbi:MAG: HipA domain-containing protein [Leifsonia sp.]